MSDNCQLPEFDSDEAAAAARRLYRLEGPIEALDGERDLNFLIGERGARFVFKIANRDEDPAMLECQHRVFELLAEAQVLPQTATPLASVNGRLVETLTSRSGARHVCRALPFIEGRTLASLGRLRPPLLEDIGRRLAQLDRALATFSHPALGRPLLWKMEHALDVLAAYKPLLARHSQRGLVEHFEAGYRERVLPRQGVLRRAVIHNDANRANLLVDDDGERLVSIIDFGDMVESWLVVEPAIAATYVMLDQPQPLALAASLLGGYHAGYPLAPPELELVFDFICMRLCASVCINAYQRSLEPGNAYLDVDLDSCWELLALLRATDPADARAALAPR